MFGAIKDTFTSLSRPHPRKVFFPRLSTNRRLLLWYVDKLVKKDSDVETQERLQALDHLRKNRTSLTFICNHLTYADSHIIETLLIRHGFRDLADHLIHVAGQKTYEIYRRFMTRSLNTIRVYQPKAQMDKRFSKKMNSKALRWAGHLKLRGYSLLVFPEGTRTRTHHEFNLHGANPRTTIYFRQSHVVPLALMGAEGILPLGSVLPRPATVQLRVGEPINNVEKENAYRLANPDRTEKEMRQDLMLLYMRQVNMLLDPEYRFQSR
jgi:glycerol-3-phosphate O-acyltransferase